MLPKLSHLVYPIEFKSINLKTTFRPFTVAEEKILLMMKDNSDVQQVKANMVQLIKSCVTDPIDPEKLAMYDVENFLVKIRSKSVGEQVELQYTDPETKKTQKATIDLESVQTVFKEGRSLTLAIQNDIGLKLRDPLFIDLITLSDETKIWDLIVSCIVQIYEGDKVWTVGEDATREEVEAFLDTIPADVSRELYEFFNNAPKVEAVATLEDGKTITLTGIMNFLVS